MQLQLGGQALLSWVLWPAWQHGGLRAVCTTGLIQWLQRPLRLFHWARWKPHHLLWHLILLVMGKAKTHPGVSRGHWTPSLDSGAGKILEEHLDQEVFLWASLEGKNTYPALVYPLATIIHIPPTCKIYSCIFKTPGDASHYGFRPSPKVKGLGPVIFLTHSRNTAQGRLLKGLHQSGKARGPGSTTEGKLGQLLVPLPVFCTSLGSMLRAFASTF